MKNTFRPSDYSIQMAVREAASYEGIYAGDDYVMKDHGDYIEINIQTEPTPDRPKGHVSFDLYFDEDGRLVRWVRHR